MKDDDSWAHDMLIGNMIGLVKSTCNLLQLADTTFEKGKFWTGIWVGFIYFVECDSLHWL